MFKCKIVKKNAIIPPVDNFSRVYQLYSCEEVIVDPNASVIVSTGLMVSFPAGYFPQILPGDIYFSRNILAKYCSYNCFSKIIGDYSEGVELTIKLVNKGLVKYKVNPGDSIAKMILVKNELLPVVEVNNFTKTDETIEKPETITLAANVAAWFKNKYMEDPEGIVSKYFDESLCLTLGDIRELEEYTIAKNKKMYEINKIWNIIPGEILDVINQDYLSDRIDALCKKRDMIIKLRQGGLPQPTQRDDNVENDDCSEDEE